MRIAIVNWSSRKAGGAETYIERVIGGLRCAGHEMALFCETDLPADRAPITLPREAPLWSISKMGLEAAINALRAWHPDMIYAHGLTDPAIEARTLQVAPAVLFAHNYYGTCISGAKTFKFPVVRPCARRFGWQCLMHFYPHRCGGLNPIAMWTDFRLQSRRLKTLHSYQAIVTASEHMRSEYLGHGFAPEAVEVISLPVERPGSQRAIPASKGNVQSGVDADSHPLSDGAYELLFAGRMDLLKGGAVLLDALPYVLSTIGRPLHMTFVGDGPERRKWQEKGARLEAREPNVRINFTGWLAGEKLERAFSDSDLLVVPSLWAEPFGLLGPEAGLHGLPAAGFAVGGIPEWLIDGVNGHLAPGDPPTRQGLVDAVTRCLQDPAAYRQLRIGALKVARRFSVANHIGQLTRVFEAVMAAHPQPTTAGLSFSGLQ